MSYAGDYATGGIIYDKFTTRQATGVPFTLAGTPVVSIYKDNSTTESVAGVTLTPDFDSKTGLNQLAVDTSADPTFYSNGSQFVAVITTGTVNGVTVVGEVVSRFTLKAQSAVQTGDAYARLGAPVGASISADIAAVQTSATAIKAKTDNLPASPADETLIIAATNSIQAKLGTPAGASVSADIAAVEANAVAIKAKTDNIPASPASVSDIPTAAQNAIGLLDVADGIETGQTVRHGLRLMLAALAGKLAGAATTTVTIRDTNDSKNRISATVDSDGNRTAVTLDGS